MPASIVKSLAAKSGKSEAEGERLWSKAKAAAKKEGRKDDYAYITGVFKKMLGLKESLLVEDGIITGFGRKQDDWQREECPTPGRKIRSKGRGRGLGVGRGRGPIGRMGAPNNMGRGVGPVEQKRYRVFLNGDEVQMIHDGQQVALGADGNVEHVREKIQDLLDSDVESVFDMGGFVGTLAEIERQVLDDWMTFCGGDSPAATITDGGH